MTFRCTDNHLPDIDGLSGIQRGHMDFPLVHQKSRTVDAQRLDALYLPTNLSRIDANHAFYERLGRYAERVYIVSDEISRRNAKGAASILLQQGELIGIEKISTLHNLLMQVGSGDNPSQIFTKSYNLPAKRNFALRHAQENNFNRIMLLDDDIEVADEAFLNALDLLDDSRPIVGFYVLDYPDVSTIDHIRRMCLRKPSPVSVGGNCILLQLPRVSGFFPYIYNEDWHFLYAANFEVKKIAAGTATQLTHEPWRVSNRVEFEQFGDVIAKGMEENMRANRYPLVGDKAYWSCIVDTHMDELRTMASTEALGPEYRDALARASIAMGSFTVDSILDFIACYLDELRTPGGRNARNTITR